MKIKAIIRKYVLNNIGYKILSLVFAFLLWLVILNIQDPEYTRTIGNVKVQILNEDLVLDGTHVYTISSGETTTVSVTGKRSIISMMTASDFLVTADFEELSITNAVPIKVSLTGDKSRYSNQVIVGTRDSSMIINLEEMTSAQLPVEVDYKGTLAENVLIEEANLSPKKVTIYAPQSVVDAAQKVLVIADSGQINADCEFTLPAQIVDEDGTFIKQENGVSLDQTDISVEFKVSYKKNVPIEYEIYGTPAEGYALASVELSQDFISVKGTAADIGSLEAVYLPADLINVDGAVEGFSFDVDLSSYLPDTVTVYGESPAVTVTVSIVTQEEYNRMKEKGELQTEGTLPAG